MNMNGLRMMVLIKLDVDRGAFSSSTAQWTPFRFRRLGEKSRPSSSCSTSLCPELRIHLRDTAPHLSKKDQTILHAMDNRNLTLRWKASIRRAKR